jgi:hypothetical protein
MDVLKLPPYGKSLAFQLSTGKEPLFVPVCVGENCWDRAKFWLGCEAMPPLVLPTENKPSDYRWVVDDCFVVVDVDEGVDDITLCELVALLLRAGAITVTVWRKWAVNSITQYEQGCGYE